MAEKSDSTTSGAGGGKSKRVIVDIGARKKSLVRQLRKGEGELMAEVDQTLEDLRANGRLDSGAQPVIFIVRQKSKRNRLCPFCMLTKKM